MPTVDINADIGEGMPWDDELMEIVTSVNVCLGEHAGKWEDSLRTMERARAKGLRVGFHPGYPDRPGFGRDTIQPDRETMWLGSIEAQVQKAIDAFEPDYVKPHGAFYHDAEGSIAVSHTLGVCLNIVRKPLMGMEGTSHERIAENAGVLFIREAFAERGYRDGKLIPRGEPGAELLDINEIIEQVQSLATHADSICIHGDRRGCVDIARAVREALVG